MISFNEDHWFDRVRWALSIRQPWAWCILNAHKDIENRTWFTSFRGRFLIHAAKTMTARDYSECDKFLERIAWNVELPPPQFLERGGIVGVANLADCVEEADSPWFVGPAGFVLDDVRELKFRPCVGRLGFFRPKYEN